MSWFVKFLKFILCVEDEEREVSRHSSYEYQRLSVADSYSRTIPAQNTLGSQPNFVKTSTSSEIPYKWLQNSVDSCSIQNRESIQSNPVLSRYVADKSSTRVTDPCNKVPIVSIQYSRPSSAKPPSATKFILPEVPPKPNHIISSSSSAEILQKAKTNQILNKASQQNSPSGNVISASSLRSHASFKPPSVTTKSSPSLVSEKSSQSVHKPKDFSFSPSNYNDNKSFRFSPVYDTGKQSPTTKKNPQLSTLQQAQSPKPPPLSSKPTLSPTTKKNPQLSTLQQAQSPKPPPLSSKPTLSPLPSSSTSQQKKNDYVWVDKSGTTTYEFPMHIKRLVQKDIVPGVLKTPLSPATYKDYFHALLCAEDCHLEEWEGFELKNVTLELHDATIYTRKGKTKSYISAANKDEKVFVAFDIDEVLARQSLCARKPERRPFLLSRDSVSVNPVGSSIKPFQGVIYRVVKSSLVLADFGESFHLQHDSDCEYDVKFSFNRVCLKRAHHAITAAPETIYRNFLFPEFVPKQELASTDLFVNYGRQKETFAIHQILRLQGSPPYLVEGPLSIVDRNHLSRTAEVVVEAVVQICRKSPSNKVLLCAPLNNTCDLLMRALKKQINQANIFRANAAFREVDGVPVDILPSCLYEEEMDCFACPSLESLKKYKVISSTFMSSFRLRDEGMIAGHFSHIFLVDASSVTEPEAVVPLANFASANTIVVVSGAPRNRSGWVRSKIARENGLRISYFERLQGSKLYKNLDPRVITRLDEKP